MPLHPQTHTSTGAPLASRGEIPRWRPCVLRPLAAAAFAILALLPSSPVGATPTPKAPPDGLTLSGPIRTFLWNATCDALVADDGVACTDSNCPLVRSDGQRFSPVPQRSLWHFMGTSMTLTSGPFKEALTKRDPALREEDLPWLRQEIGAELSGLPIPFKVGGGLVISPKIAQWAWRNLVPPPEQSMCGATAGEIYRLAFADGVRLFADVFLEIKKLGGFAKVNPQTIDREFDEGRGPSVTMCRKVASSFATFVDEQTGFFEVCQWWVRRGATRSEQTMAQLLASVLSVYDPELHAQRYAKALPKPWPRPEGAKP